MDNKKLNLSRRQFLGTSLIGLAGITVLPLKSCMRPSDTINLGIIGLGRQAMFLMDSFIKMEGIRVIAGADVYAVKRERFLLRANEYYKNAGLDVKVNAYEDYRKILDNRDVDAVVIASPDHWHALMAIDACNAGKNIYLEKPLTLSIYEGQLVTKAVRDNNIILAVGSQQRSDPNFQHAVNLVQTGKLGALQKVNFWVGEEAHPKPYLEPEEALPEGLNWDMWTGPAPKMQFNKILNPPISLNPPKDEEFWGGWRWYSEFGGGFMTDWGAHMIDIAQWAMGYDKSGPVKITPLGFEGAEFLTYEYANGVQMTHELFRPGIKGVKFIGADAWIEVARGHFETSDESLRKVAEDSDVPYEGRSVHHENFIDAVRKGVDPVVPVEIGHSTCTACTLGNIADELKRTVKWDPAAESFVDDAEANAKLKREYLNGYTL
jgi:predicted dehydrogenase